MQIMEMSWLLDGQQQNQVCLKFYLLVVFKDVVFKILSEEVFNIIQIVFIIYLCMFNVAPFYRIELFIEAWVYVVMGCFHVL